MKKSKYSDAQIISFLKQAENGVPVADLCRERGMSSASFYNWRSKYGGMVDLSRFRAAPIAHLCSLCFEGQGAFPAEC